MEQSVHFVRAPDRVRIAYAVTGDGPPVVKTPNWLTHIEFDYRSPGGQGRGRCFFPALG
jgi:hypothetical protein